MRSRSLAGLVVVAAAAGLVCSVVVPTTAQIEVDRAALFADGRSTCTARLSSRTVWGLAPWLDLGVTQLQLHTVGAEALGVQALPAHDGALVLRAGHTPGRLRLVAAGAAPVELTVTLDPRDADEDGYPDAAELLTREDRAAFVRWFTTLAEAQHHRLDDGWARVHQDCAGLVRFAYREALKRHDDGWLSRRRYLPRIDQPDVSTVRYPDLPFMGELPFSLTGRPFDPARPAKAQFTAAPDAKTLWQANTTFVSRDVADARAGHLLFFRVPYGRGSRMHTMIVLGDRVGASHTDPGRRVVYHTGAGPEDGGEVRLVGLETLAAHPDPDWHPAPDNPRFLGVFALDLLEHRPARQPWAANLYPGIGDER